MVSKLKWIVHSEVLGLAGARDSAFLSLSSNVMLLECRPHFSVRVSKRFSTSRSVVFSRDGLVVVKVCVSGSHTVHETALGSL